MMQCDDAICCASDINELSLPKTCQVEFPDSDDLLTFKLIISPDEVSKSQIVCSFALFVLWDKNF